MMRKVSKRDVDIQFHEARRGFPFRLTNYEEDGFLTKEMVRNRVDYSLIDVMSRLGGWIANNFEFSNALDAIEQFNVVLDKFYGTAQEIVERFRRSKEAETNKEVKNAQLEDTRHDNVQRCGAESVRGGGGHKTASARPTKESRPLPGMAG